MRFLSRLPGCGLRQVMALALVLSLISGCTVTSVPIVAEPAAVAAKVKRGDVINIVTIDHQHLRFTVEAVSEQGLAGVGQSVEYQQISEIAIEEKEISKAGAVGITVIAVVLAFAVGWAIAELIDSGVDRALSD